MPSTTAKKTTKNTSASSSHTNGKREIKVVTIRPTRGTLSASRFDAIVKEHGGRPLTAEEKRQFRKLAKDPYP